MIQRIGDLFLLGGKNYSYAFNVWDGKLVHTYFGKRINSTKEENISLITKEHFPYFYHDCQLYEIGEFGRADFRIPSVLVKGKNFFNTDFIYKDYKIINGDLNEEYPHFRGKSETLVIKMYDEVAKLTLKLYYTVFENSLVTKAELINNNEDEIKILNLSSLMLDLPIDDYNLIDLNGRWGNEFNLTKRHLEKGIYEFSSTRGVSSHQHQPFLGITYQNTDEDNGEAIGLSLVYSGNFAMKAECDEKNQLRITAGVNILDDGIILKKDEKFITPEAVMVYSSYGLTGLTHNFHDLIREHLLNPNFKDKDRPIVLNSWESMYFDFDENKFIEFIKSSKDLGIDTVVMDDGWFKNRNNDKTSLGDWVFDKKKLPNELENIIKVTKECGLKFGLWFEPEAISKDSDLFKLHPEWALHTLNRDGIQLRTQYVIDFSNKEVVNYIYNSMKLILNKYDISYVKWDMNRPLSDVISSSKYIEFVKGMYDLYERLSLEFPDVLIEGCSSGGGRFDLGILYYSPLIWTSDDSDGYERMKIQYGASFIYPLNTLSNHISSCPNHQTNRMTPLFTRYAVASLGDLGCEFNPVNLSKDDKEEISKYIASYKEDRKLILNGDLYRLRSPLDTNEFSMQVVSKDKKESYLVFSEIFTRPNLPIKRLKLKGLNSEYKYKIKELNIVVTGELLMNFGLIINPPYNDFGTTVLHLSSLEGEYGYESNKKRISKSSI